RAMLHDHPPPLVCHAPHVAQRLEMHDLPAYDVLELFAFIHPARFCVPTPRGLAQSLHLMPPESAEDACLGLKDIVRHLLTDLMNGQCPQTPDPAALAAMMGLCTVAGDDAPAGWLWSPVVLAALGRDK